jgi:hypothetical protein
MLGLWVTFSDVAYDVGSGSCSIGGGGWFFAPGPVGPVTGGVVGTPSPIGGDTNSGGSGGNTFGYDVPDGAGLGVDVFIPVSACPAGGRCGGEPCVFA